MIYLIFTFILYYVANVESLLPDTGSQHQGLPEIHEGESCIKGHLYRMYCNTCRCGENGALICTKMACLNEAMMQKLKKKKALNGLRLGKKRDESVVSEIEKVPDLPEGECVPGRLYKEGCQLCFCNDTKVPDCSKKPCETELSANALRDPENFRSAFTDEEHYRLPTMEHLSTKCDPGKSYKVDCNDCICLENGNLMCTSKLCVTPEGQIRLSVLSNSGKPCTKSYEVTTKCIRCDCVNTKSKCVPIAGCKPAKIQMLSNKENNQKESLDLEKEKCIPGMVYRVHCNKCYCQSDRTLRCTQKTCLNYSETVNLHKQRLYLEKYGL